MRTTKRITQEVEVTDDVICNRCGESCTLHDLGDRKVFGGLWEAKVRGCYDSRVLPDCTAFTFSLCEEWVDGKFCMREPNSSTRGDECGDCGSEGDCVRCRP